MVIAHGVYHMFPYVIYYCGLDEKNSFSALNETS